jgi:NAD(P)-dependent dehydrogenase (short-subunit alcohol dehydrogenase family)
MSQAAIVTGASSGIGEASARRLGTSGYAVLAVGRDQDALERTCRAIVDAGGSARSCAADVTAADAPRAIVARAMSEFGRIDAVVNAAGIIASGSVADTTDEGWDVMLDVNVRAPFRLIREATPALVESRGAVVNVSSVAGPRAFPGVAAYCVSKAAVDQLTRCAALDLAPRGVRVNSVNPGVVRTNLHRRSGMDEQKYADFLDRSTTTHPLGRVGTVEEIADVVAFLLSTAAGWITGETVLVDGGRHLTCFR